jgi:hypothetical protein
VTTDVLELVPEPRTDFERRDIDSECVVWSSLASEPTALDAVATVMLDVIDGTASIGQLAREVHEEVGIPLEAAQTQVARIVEQFSDSGLLTTSMATTNAAEAIASRELFVTNATPCAENESRLGTVSLNLRLGERTIRVACDSRRAARTLGDALAEHVVEGDDDAPLAFVLTAPQGLKRSHRLVDRSGFVLSVARGLDTGLHALASHLTALLPPAPGTVRIQSRGIVAGDRTVLCLSPLLYNPTIDERQLAGRGLDLIDRLAVDVDTATGRIVNPEIPWPALAALSPGAGHAGTAGTRTVTAVVDAVPAETAPRSPAAMVARIAANGLHGSTADLLDAALRLVAGAEMRSSPLAAEPLLAVLAT